MKLMGRFTKRVNRPNSNFGLLQMETAWAPISAASGSHLPRWGSPNSADTGI